MAAIFYFLLPGAVVSLLWIAAIDVERLPVALPSLLVLPFLSLLPAAARDYVPLSEPPTTGRQSSTNVVIGMLITVVGAGRRRRHCRTRPGALLPHLISGRASMTTSAAPPLLPPTHHGRFRP